MNTQGDPMNPPAQPKEDTPTRRDSSRKRLVRVSALLNAATLGAAVLVVAMASPKLPPFFGD
jgi:hypothetical protein